MAKRTGVKYYEMFGYTKENHTNGFLEIMKKLDNKKKEGQKNGKKVTDNR